MQIENLQFSMQSCSYHVKKHKWYVTRGPLTIVLTRGMFLAINKSAKTYDFIEMLKKYPEWNAH